MVRGWFRTDVHDRNRRKVVPNASSAIDAMQVFTKTDLYTDFKASAANYPFDRCAMVVSIMTRSSNSGTAATIRLCQRPLKTECANLAPLLGVAQS